MLLDWEHDVSKYSMMFDSEVWKENASKYPANSPKVKIALPKPVVAPPAEEQGEEEAAEDAAE